MERIPAAAMLAGLLMLASPGASAQRERAVSTAPDSGAALTWWVMGTGGIIGSADGSIALSATAGQSGIARTSGDAASASLGFWLPKSPVETGTELTNSGTSYASAIAIRSYPNPFRASTTISYQLPAGGDVTLRVFDATGRLVRGLVSKREDAGRREVIWNGVDDEGNQVASGAYYFILSVESDAGGATSSQPVSARGVICRVR
jgi:hypothetical protein